MTTESAPSTFKSMSLSIEPSSLDLPVILLYFQGDLLDQLPGGIVQREGSDYGVESEEEDVDSEDERNAGTDRMKQRRDWDRSEVRHSWHILTRRIGRLIRAFKLCAAIDY